MQPLIRAGSIAAMLWMAASAAGCAGGPRLADRAWRAGPQAPATLSLAAPVRQSAPDGCGPAALATVLRHWGTASSAAGVRGAAARPAGGGSRLGDLAASAVSRGYEAILFRGTLRLLAHHTTRGRPVVVVLPASGGRRHCAVVTGVDWRRGAVVFYDPLRGTRVADLADFAAAWREAGAAALLIAPAAVPVSGIAAGALTPRERAALQRLADPSLADRVVGSGGAAFFEIIGELIADHPFVAIGILLVIVIVVVVAAAV